ncbi:MAG: histidine kinase, partial [Chitinophagales bacterium]
MKQISFLIVLCLFTANSFAQVTNKHQADSMQKELSLHLKPDSTRALLLNALTEPLTLSDPAKALQYAQEILQISNSINWAKGRILAYRAITSVYITLSDYKNAFDNLLLAETAAEKSGNQRFINSMYTMRANIYAGMQQYDQALIYHRKYLEATQKMGPKTEEVLALLNVGDDYINLKKLDSGYYFLDQALVKARALGMTLYVGYILSSITEIYIEKKDYANAIKNCEEILKDPANINVRSMAESGLADVYAEKNDFQKAEYYCKQTLDDVTKIGDIGREYQVYELLSRIYEKQHKDKQALAAYKTFITLRDSVMNTDKKQEIDRKELQYEFTKEEAKTKADNDKKQALAASEIMHERTVGNGAIGGSILLLIAGAGSFGFYKRKRDADQAKADAELKAQVTDTELKALRAQMNPHFIFNSLNSVSDYISRNETQAADNYLTKFARLMRVILENSEEKEVPLAEDLEALEWYMQLEAMRMNHKFTYTINVSADIDPQATMI